MSVQDADDSNRVATMRRTSKQSARYTLGIADSGLDARAERKQCYPGITTDHSYEQISHLVKLSLRHHNLPHAAAFPADYKPSYELRDGLIATTRRMTKTRPMCISGAPRLHTSMR